MKKLIYLLAATLFALTGCDKETIIYNPLNPGDEPSDVIANLSISSKNTWFTTEDNLKGAINYKTIGGEVVVNVKSNVEWSYKGADTEWLSIEKNDEVSQLILKCESNKKEQQQKATVTIEAGNKSSVITVTQNAYGTLEIAASKNNFEMPARGELTSSFSVTSSDEAWEFETKACPWMLVEKDGDQVKLTFDANEEFADRETIIILAAGRGGEILSLRPLALHRIVQQS